MVDELELLEIRLLVTAIKERYGYDFSDYAEASQMRRIKDSLARYQCKNISELQHKILHDPDFFTSFLNNFTITVSDFFRDPDVYKSLQNQVFPYLETYSRIKVWVAGCAQGEEVYSLAIMFKEANLLDRTMIYATDINPLALEKARSGIFSLESFKNGSINYIKANGKRSLSEYFTVNYDSVIISNDLRSKVTYSDHNLASDHSFGEMQLICCRNVLIYFNQKLQDRALSIINASMEPGAFLALGTRETLKFSKQMRDFCEFVGEHRIYRKKRVRDGRC
ncbi:MAG: protein-glutamate O-methyltransferase CheR [Bdellovibrionota bacterium]